ncbi:MAG: universal stress protein [Oscillochloris sp.]|nr:universal stress protein [Oscillochloris sp.]
MSEQTPYRTIVVALDGSSDAERALVHACNLARAFDSRLLLVRAAERIKPQASERPSEITTVVPGASSSVDLGGMAAATEPGTAMHPGVASGYPAAPVIPAPGHNRHPVKAAEDVEAIGYLHIKAQEMREAGWKVEHMEPLDSPSDAILVAAKDRDADLIVMATHNRGGLEKLFFGSTTDKVIREAPCPVMLVRID